METTGRGKDLGQPTLEEQELRACSALNMIWYSLEIVKKGRRD